MAALRQYLAVWRIPGGPILVIVGVIARLGIGITPLALLLLVRDVTGRYALAAVVGAVYALAGAALGPVAGRVVDRIGPTPVLLVTAVAHPAGLVAVLLASRLGESGFVAIVVAAAFAGATYPPLTAAIRGAWTVLTGPDSGRHQLRGTALAAETSLFEIVFVLGPALVAAFLAIANPAAAIAGAALLTLVGTAVVARGSAMRGFVRHPAHIAARGLGPLRVAGFPALMVCAAGLGVAFGAAGVIVPAYATAYASHHSEEVAGILLALWATGSASGGFWFGTRRPGPVPARQFARLLAALAAVFAAMPNPWALGIALVAGGATIGPALTVESALVGRIIPGGMLNEAYTWMVTVSVAASAVGGAVAGLIVDQPGGVPWAFLFGGAAVAVAAAVAAPPAGSIARADAQASAALTSPRRPRDPHRDTSRTPVRTP
jgi:MFS family permease